MVFTYLIVPDKDLILQRVEGPINKQDLQICIEEVWRNPDYNPKYKGIVDLRKADILLSPKELSEVSEYIMQSHSAGTGTFALLANKPFEIALSMIFEAKMAPQQSMSVFSEEENATKFLEISAADFDLLNSAKAKAVRFKNDLDKYALKNPGQK